MSEILFLAHRIPYPPDKGDKIRSYHLFRALCQQHTVHLGAFVDDPADWKQAEALKAQCGQVCLIPLRRGLARIRSVRALLSHEPMTMEYFRHPGMWRWTRSLARTRRLDGVFAFSSSMGQYAEGLQIAQGGARVIDFCDVDSDKWQQYAGASGSLIGRVFAREAENLRDYEQRYLRNFDATLVISSTEASILSEGAGDAASKIKVVPNGVNTRYFDPELRFPSPFASGRPAMVFTGAMDYNANVDGVCWFVEAVLPQIRRQVPEAVFWIVGSNPVRAIRALESNSGVVVTGRVPDVRPFLTHAAVVVAPLRIARGVQNKVLEGLAMSRPIVATPNALQGIPNADRAGVRVAANDDEFSTEVTRIIRSPREQPQGREFVRAEYCWDRHMSPVRELFRNRL